MLNNHLTFRIIYYAQSIAKHDNLQLSSSETPSQVVPFDGKSHDKFEVI